MNNGKAEAVAQDVKSVQIRFTGTADGNEVIGKLYRLTLEPDPHEAELEFCCLSKEALSSFVDVLQSEGGVDLKGLITAVAVDLSFFEGNHHTTSNSNSDLSTHIFDVPASPTLDEAKLEQFAEFLGILPNWSKLIPTCEFPHPLPAISALLGVVPSKLEILDLSRFDFRSRWSDQHHFVDFAAALETAIGLTSITFPGPRFANKHNTPEKWNPMLGALASLPHLSAVDFGGEGSMLPQGCDDALQALCAASNLETLRIPGEGFDMAMQAIVNSTAIKDLCIEGVLDQHFDGLKQLLRTNRVLQALDLRSGKCDGRVQRVHQLVDEPHEEGLVKQLLQVLTSENTTLTTLFLDLPVRKRIGESFEATADMMLGMLEENTSITKFSTFERDDIASDYMYARDEEKAKMDRIHHLVLLNNFGRKNWRNADQSFSLAAFPETMIEVMEALDNLPNISTFLEDSYDRAVWERRLEAHRQHVVQNLQGDPGKVIYGLLALQPGIWINSLLAASQFDENGYWPTLQAATGSSAAQLEGSSVAQQEANGSTMPGKRKRGD